MVVFHLKYAEESPLSANCYQHCYLLAKGNKLGIPWVLHIAQAQGNSSEGTRAMGCQASWNAQLYTMQTVRTKQ